MIPSTSAANMNIPSFKASNLIPRAVKKTTGIIVNITKGVDIIGYMVKVPKYLTTFTASVFMVYAISTTITLIGI